MVRKHRQRLLHLHERTLGARRAARAAGLGVRGALLVWRHEIRQQHAARPRAPPAGEQLWRQRLLLHHGFCNAAADHAVATVRANASQGHTAFSTVI